MVCVETAHHLTYLQVRGVVMDWRGDNPALADSAKFIWTAEERF